MHEIPKVNKYVWLDAFKEINNQNSRYEVLALLAINLCLSSLILESFFVPITLQFYV